MRLRQRSQWRRRAFARIHAVMFEFLSAHMSKATVVGAVFVILFIAERALPETQSQWWRSGLARNFTLAILNFFMAPFIILPITFFATSHALGLRPHGWNMAFDLLLLDVWIYVWHRLNHVVPFFWRFHEVHHLDESLDTSTALRFHFGEVAMSSVVRAAVIWLVGIPFTTVMIFETLVVVASLFHHSNLRLPVVMEVMLSKLIVTPSLHWVHHHAKRQDTDSNYATILSIWDIVFSTRSPTARASKMKMGVEGSKDENIMRLILRPFWK